MKRMLLCPACNKKGFESRFINLNEPKSRLKCRKCGEWNNLDIWLLSSREEERLQHISTRNYIKGEISRKWDYCEQVYVIDIIKIIDSATWSKCARKLTK